MCWEKGFQKINVKSMGYVSRKKAFELISKSKASVSSYENLFSLYFIRLS